MKSWAPKISLLAPADVAHFVGKDLWQRAGSTARQLGTDYFTDPIDLYNGRGSAAAQTLAGQIQAVADFAAGAGGSDEVWGTGIDPTTGKVLVYCDGTAGGEGVSFSITGGSAFGFTEGQASALGTVAGIDGNVQVCVAANDFDRGVFDGQLTITTSTPNAYTAPETPGRALVLTMLRERGAVGGPDDAAAATCLEAIDQAAAVAGDPPSLSTAPRWLFDAQGRTLITWPDGENIGAITWLDEDFAAYLGFIGGEAAVKVSTARGDLWVLTSSEPAEPLITPSRSRKGLVLGRQHIGDGGRLASGRLTPGIHHSHRTGILTFYLDASGDRVSYRDLEDHYDRWDAQHVPPGGTFTVYQDWPGEIRRHRWHTEIRPSTPAYDLSYTSDRSPRRGRLIVDRELGDTAHELASPGRVRRGIEQTWRVTVA